MSGNLSQYQIRLVEDIGQDAFDDLKLRSNQIKKWTMPELESINKDALDGVKKLKNYLGDVVK